MYIWKIFNRGLYLKIIFIIVIIIAPGLSSIFNFSNGNSNASAKVITVNPAGSSDYQTISAAIDNASSGDTIFVHHGIYYENITLNKTLNLYGSGEEDTIIFGNLSDSIVKINAN